jgi:hypothetical protein
VQADATSGTFQFTMMHSDVMRVQAYVPQDQAFGLSPGDEAVIHVPEMPNRSFPARSHGLRMRCSLEPGRSSRKSTSPIPMVR